MGGLLRLAPRAGPPARRGIVGSARIQAQRGSPKERRCELGAGLHGWPPGGGVRLRGREMGEGVGEERREGGGAGAHHSLGASLGHQWRRG